MLFYETSQNIEQGYDKQLHLWVKGIENFTKMFDLQLEPYEKLVHFSKDLEQESVVLHFRSIILDKKLCLFTKKRTQSERRTFWFIAEEFERGSGTFATEGEKIGLPRENVTQLSSKHNKYQVSFIQKVRVPGSVLLLSNFLLFVETCLIIQKAGQKYLGIYSWCFLCNCTSPMVRDLLKYF